MNTEQNSKKQTLPTWKSSPIKVTVMTDWKEHRLGNMESDFKVQFIKETLGKSLHF